MANYSRRERHTRVIEYTIPLGDAIAEFHKASTAALREWGLLNPGETPYDDWCRVYADDKHIVLRLETERLMPGSEEA